MLSMNDRWLLAMMKAPVSGTLWRPLTRGRNTIRNSGRSSNRASR